MIATAYVGLTTLQFVVAVAVALAGIISFLLVVVGVGAWVIRREVDEHRFRQQLRRAQAREDAARATGCSRAVAVSGEGRAHRTRYDMRTLPVRRGDL